MSDSTSDFSQTAFPELPSLKEQAIEALIRVSDEVCYGKMCGDLFLIHRALERLP